MLDPQNLVTISGGLIAEPEMVADGKIAKIRLAVDYAGSEKNFRQLFLLKLLTISS